MEPYTIEILADELNIGRPKIKEILGLEGNTANATELTAEQILAVRDAVAAPPVAEQPPAAEPPIAESSVTEPPVGTPAYAPPVAEPPVVEPPAVEPTAPPVEEEETNAVKFYWPKMKRASFSLGRRDKQTGEVMPAIRRAAVNGVLTLFRDNPEDALVIAHLEKHGDNEANGGTKFSKFVPCNADISDVGQKIDELMKMQPRTLVQLAADATDGSLVNAQAMTVGEQIKAVLDL